MAISEGRKAMIEEDAKGLSGGGGSIWNYVDRQRAEELGLHQYRPKKAPSDNFIRIVAANTKDPFRLIVWRHQNVGANGNTYLCLNKMYNERCPVCDLLAQLRLEDPKHPALEVMYASRRVLMYVVDTTDEETEAEGPKWFDCPPSIYTAVCDLAKAKRTGEITDVACPNEGCHIIFERKQKKGNPYTGFELEKASSIPKEWFKDLPEYEDILLLPEVEDIELQLSGIGPGSRPPVKDDKKTSSHRSQPAKDKGTSRRSRPAEDKPEISSRRSRLAEDKGKEKDPPFDADAPQGEEKVQEQEQEQEQVAKQEAASEEPKTEGTSKIRSRLDDIRENRLNR